MDLQTVKLTLQLNPTISCEAFCELFGANNLMTPQFLINLENICGIIMTSKASTSFLSEDLFVCSFFVLNKYTF